MSPYRAELGHISHVLYRVLGQYHGKVWSVLFEDQHDAFSPLYIKNQPLNIYLLYHIYKSHQKASLSQIPKSTIPSLERYFIGNEEKRKERRKRVVVLVLSRSEADLETATRPDIPHLLVHPVIIGLVELHVEFVHHAGKHSAHFQASKTINSMVSK